MNATEPLDQFSSKMASGDEMRIDPAACALIVVDMVNAYLRPGGEMPVAEPAPVLAAVERLVDVCRSRGGSVVWVRPGHTESADGLFRKRIPHAIGETEGAQVHDSLVIRPTDKLIKKRRYSSFFGTDLDLYLREHGVGSVIVCGVALNICVRSTVQDAFFYGYDVFVVEDACQATGRREHESSIYDIETHFGTVLSVDEVQRQLA